jgi:hypothetical protein
MFRKSHETTFEFDGLRRELSLLVMAEVDFIVELEDYGNAGVGSLSGEAL